MKKSLYICNANTTQRVVGHTDNTAISVFPCGISAPRRCVVFAKLTKEIRSLFVHKRTTCYTMRTPNKQATKAKNSNLSRSIYTATIGTLVAVALALLIADADNTAVLILTKIVGVTLMLLASHLANKWRIVTSSDYSNEYYPNL